MSADSPGPEAAPAERALPAAGVRWGSLGKALFATTCWGLSFVAVRIALEGLSPHLLVGLRSGLGAAILLLLLALRGLPLLPEAADRPRCLLLGLLFGVHLIVQTVALGMTTAIHAGWIIAFVPVVVALLGAAFLSRRLMALGWAGIALATAGVLLVTSAPAELGRAGLGDLLMLSTCFTWAGYTLLSFRPMQTSGALRTTAFSMGLAALMGLAAAWLAGRGTGTALLPSGRCLAALLFLGIGPSALATWAFNSAVSEIGPERTSAFQYLQPGITLLGSAALLDEPLSAAIYQGGPLILLGVWMIQRSKLVSAARPA
jgi:drug/metabolite transporter (DMT)-like permease